MQQQMDWGSEYGRWSAAIAPMTRSSPLPLLQSIQDERELVRRVTQWVYCYNVEREHSGWQWTEQARGRS